MNILIIQSAKLGDMICTTPMFRAVKEAYPNAKLYAMGSAINEETVAGNPYIDEYYVSPDDLREFRTFLQDKKIDAAVMLAPAPELLKQLLLARVAKVVVPQIKGGWSPYATMTYRLLSIFATRVPMYFGQYMPLQYLRLLKPLGIHAEDTRKELFYTPLAQKRAEDLLPGSGFLVAIAPGAGGQSKTWGGERFAKVASHLSQSYGATIIILGSERDVVHVDTMRNALPQGVNVIDLVGKLSLDELKAVVSKLNLFISADTGPMYIAETFGVPTVDIVGPMDEREQPPRGPRNLVVVPKGRLAPAVHILNASVIDNAEAERQAEAISVEEVVAAVDKLVKEIKTG